MKKIEKSIWIKPCSGGVSKWAKFWLVRDGVTEKGTLCKDLKGSKLRAIFETKGNSRENPKVRVYCV